MRGSNCYDNAKMESFWATLETELIDGQVYATRAAAKSALFSYIEVSYNRMQHHGALGHTSWSVARQFLTHFLGNACVCHD